MDASVWDGLTKVEYELMICAMEAWGILPYACSGLNEDGEPIPEATLAAAVLTLVDRGLVEVRRIEPWTTPDGDEGATYGAAIDRGDLPGLLADPDTWDDPGNTSWIGEVALARTAAWEPNGQV